MGKSIPAAFVVAMLSVAGGAHGSDLTTRQVIGALQRATPEAPADFSGLDLKFLDLSDLDFSRANFSGANLRSANLTGANFADADLSGADLTRAIIIRADFSGADLSNANVYRPVTFSNEDAAPKETPIFRETNFSGAHLIIHLVHADLSGADFSMARLELKRGDVFPPAQIWWSNLSGANFSGANLSGRDHRDIRPSLRRSVENDRGRRRSSFAAT